MSQESLSTDTLWESIFSPLKSYLFFSFSLKILIKMWANTLEMILDAHNFGKTSGIELHVFCSWKFRQERNLFIVVNMALTFQVPLPWLGSQVYEFLVHLIDTNTDGFKWPSLPSLYVQPRCYLRLEVITWFCTTCLFPIIMSFGPRGDKNVSIVGVYLTLLYTFTKESLELNIPKCPW